MEIKSKIFKRKSGKNKGAWIVRIQYQDETGKIRYLERHADTKGAASDKETQLLDEVRKSHGHIKTGERMTFNNLADYCETHFYKPAVYAEGRKVSGVRGLAGAKSAIAALKKYFGARLLKTIYRASLRDYKAHRLQIISEHTERNLSIATVNRELSVLRRMLKVALAEGWILRDPFLGESLINIADEKKRERILSRSEEKSLLEACTLKKMTVETKRSGKPLKMEIEVDRSYLRPLIVLALDTGMRRGELFKLRWQDVDFNNELIRVCATHTKTQKERIVPMTIRAKMELEVLKPLTRDERVFPFVDVKKAFQAVKDDAKLSDLRFHDLRHTAITRMVRGGVSSSEAGKIAGHTQPTTTYRYINTDLETIKNVASVLNNFSEPIIEPVSKENSEHTEVFH